MSSPNYNDMNEYDLLAFSVYNLTVGTAYLIYASWFKVAGLIPIIFGLFILFIQARGDK